MELHKQSTQVFSLHDVYINITQTDCCLPENQLRMVLYFILFKQIKFICIHHLGTDSLHQST